MSDYKGAALMLDAMPDAPVLIGDRGYDADWLRQARRARGIRPCIPGRAGRTTSIRNGKKTYRDRHRIEIMCLAASRTGAASTPATIAAPTPS